MRRGEIWWAELPPPLGSGPGFPRPVLVVQTNRYTETAIKTVVAVVITSNLRLLAAPGNVRFPSKDSGLPRESAVNVSQVVTVDKAQFRERVGVIPTHLMSRVEEGLRMDLGL